MRMVMQTPTSGLIRPLSITANKQHSAEAAFLSPRQILPITLWITNIFTRGFAFQAGPIEAFIAASCGLMWKCNIKFTGGTTVAVMICGARRMLSLNHLRLTPRSSQKFQTEISFAGYWTVVLLSGAGNLHHVVFVHLSRLRHFARRA